MTARSVPLLLALASLALLGDACRDPGEGDCYDLGICEGCTKKEHCPEGEDCIDGRCRVLEEPEPVLKEFGEPCHGDEACASGACLPEGPGNGARCTRACDDEPCPEGWECKTHLPADGDAPAALCVERIPHRLCQRCSVDSQCNAIGDHCLEVDGDLVCALDCSRGECPEGYTCADVAVPGGAARQCLPAGGSCTCSAATLGLTRTCVQTSAYGACHGWQRCEAATPRPDWGACDAPVPAREVCNGEDDDCDGLVDTADPSIDVSGLPPDPPYPACRKGAAEGGCTGIWQCTSTGKGDLFDWICGAAAPEVETCNGRDDNCDGLVDEPFRDAMGRYLQLENCGGCGVDCRQVLVRLRTDEDGAVLADAATCLPRRGEPTCIPLRCADGYYPFPEHRPVTCAELHSPACQACADDGDCRVSSDRCRQLSPDPGAFCLQSCDPASPYAGCTGEVGVRGCCPAGYRCAEVEGELLCQPESGSCICTAETAGISRGCQVVGGGGEVCQGTETCTDGPEGYGWSTCTQDELVVEVCDHLDNNCNGEVDEGFRGADGIRYDTDAHCGECNIDCPSRWDPEIQHAIGGCTNVEGQPECHIVACTTERHAVEAPCRSDADCATGRACDPQLHHCRATETCPDDPCAVTCTSDAACLSRVGPGAVCLDGLCQIEFQFLDADELEANGCECAVAPAAGPDEPDVSPVHPTPGLTYVDRDCDGIDGEAASALFVWSGTPRSAGTRAEPYRTIGEALDAFDPAWHRTVLVASGTYRENLVLRSGIQLHGGYSPDFGQRDVVLYPTLISGSEPDHGDPAHRPGTVHATGLTTRTVLSGFIVQGYDVHAGSAGPGQPAPSSYAVYLRDVGGHLELTNNLIVAGRGGDGSDGAAAGAGANGGAGAPGETSEECPNSQDCAGRVNPGGAGGRNSSCPAAVGNAGATARGYATNPQDHPGGPDTLDGRGGVNNTYGHSDPSQAHLCKYDCRVGSSDTDSANGADARGGEDGPAGAGGDGCHQAHGVINDGHWWPRPGLPGVLGAAGGGGGGGGAGGAVLNENQFTGCTVGAPFGDLGGSGGGGGAGGCGGAAGGGGSGGGGSFGVFLVYDRTPTSLPQIRGNRIRRGFGGRGGDGGGAGQGGLGGPGGSGGRAAHPAWCAGAGGAGGRGGDGGAGGGGGGGCGGVAFGIAGQYLTGAGYETSNVFEIPGVDVTGGAGGNGGPSPAGSTQAGGSGTTGVSADVGYY